MNPVRWTVMFLTVAVTASLVCQSARGANTYKAGDAVEVNYLGEWRKAVVVATNARGEVLADIDFGFGTRKAVPAASVRYEYESGALAGSRTWSDASGTFKTKAALMKIDGESVVIRKPDMKELTIKIATLSQGDQSYVRSLEKKVSDAVGSGQAWVQPPPIENFQSGIFAGAALGFGKEKPIALTPDPVPGYLKMKQAGFAFELEDFHDRIGAVIPIGGTENWILAVITNAISRDEKGTRLMWVSLAKQKVDQRHMMPPGEMVLDYHPPSRRMLTLSGERGSEPAFTLWHVSPVEKELKPIVKWRAEGRNFGYDAWARIIDGKIVLQRGERQQYVAWDTEKKEMAYRIAQESFFAAPAALSGGRKYLIMPEDERVRVLDAINGETLAAYPCANSASGVAMSEDGTRLAVLEGYSLRVWNLNNPEEPENRSPAEAIGTPFSTKLVWVGNDRLMNEGSRHDLVLFSLKRRMSLWTYDLDHEAMPEHGATRTHEIIDRHLVYAASLRQGGKWGLAVGAVQLPGPKVDELDAATDPASLLIVKRGTRVRLAVDCSSYDPQVTPALAAEIEKNGWVRDDTSTTVLHATMKLGEMQTVKYSMGGFGRPTSEQSASFTPFISNLTLYVGDKTAWSSGTRTGAPSMVSLREGQTLQGEVDRWQKPNPEFFEQVDVPESILDPAKKKGLGTTTVSSRGLIPK